MEWLARVGMRPKKTKTDSTRISRRQAGWWGEGKKAQTQLIIDLSQTSWGQFWLMRRTQADPNFLNRHTDRSHRSIQSKLTDRSHRFRILRNSLHDTYSHSFQRPFGHTVNKQADKHITQWLEMGMRERWGWGKMEQCLAVNRRQLFVSVGCNLEEWEHVLLLFEF